MIKRPSDKKLVRLDTQYNAIVVGVLKYGYDSEGNRLRQDEKQRAICSKLFGERVDLFGSQEWDEISFVLGLEGMTFDAFNAQSIESKAKMRAGMIIKSMQRTIEQYRDIMAREQEKALRKEKNAKG